MLNPCELEIDLFCRGLRIPDHVSLDGARGISRTRAGLGSGLEIVIPGRAPGKRELWMNVPVTEAFAHGSPYVLHGSPAEGYRIRHEDTGFAYPVRLPVEPAWYQRLTALGTPMSRIGVLQGTYLGIYINAVCAFWNYRPPMNCAFCTTGANVGAHEAADKDLGDVLETCRAAKAESGITFVHLNGGFQGSRGIQFAAPYVKAIKDEIGLLVGAQLTPERDFSKYDQLIAHGVDHLSFCVEFLDPDWFARLCPGKALMLGQQLFFDSMEYCASKLPRGAVSGEIIAGLEPIEKTLEAIDRITDLGAFPTVCIFRPTAGSDMAQWPAPDYADMRRVMAHVYEACRRHWIPIGAAPNIEVSLVVNPDDAAYLAPRTPATWVFEAYRRGIKFAAQPLFRWKMRPRGRHAA